MVSNIVTQGYTLTDGDEMKQRAFTGLMWVIALAAVVSSLRSVASVYYVLMPVSHWVVYHDVYPVEPTFGINEDLRFISHISRENTADLYYDDKLYCRKEGSDQYRRQSQMPSSHLAAAPVKYIHVQWPYLPGVPYEAECYLESNIKVQLPLGLSKAITLNGLKRGHIFNIVALTEEEGGNADTKGDRETDSYSGNGGSAPE